MEKALPTNLVWVTSKMMDIFLNPLQGSDLINKAVIARRVWFTRKHIQRQKTKDIQSVIGGDKYCICFLQ